MTELVVPRWLDRILPHIDVEGHAVVPAELSPDSPEVERDEVVTRL